MHVWLFLQLFSSAASSNEACILEAVEDFSFAAKCDSLSLDLNFRTNSSGAASRATEHCWENCLWFQCTSGTKKLSVLDRQLPCSLSRVALQMCSCKFIRKFEIVVLLARMLLNPYVFVHASYVFIPICLLVILLLYACACILQLSQHLWNDIWALAMHILFQDE